MGKFKKYVQISMLVFAFNSPMAAAAQDNGGGWIKCEATSRTVHQGVGNAGAAQGPLTDHLAGFFRVDGGTITRLSQGSGGWVMDDRCNTEDFHGSEIITNFCRADNETITFRHTTERYRGDARRAVARGDDYISNHDYFVQMNRRNGTFTYDRRETIGERMFSERLAGSCEAVTDPRPAARF